MNKVIFVYTDEFKNLDFGEGHPMRGDRYKKALKEFVKIGLIEKMKIIKPRNYPEKFIELFHSPNYVDLVKKVSKEGFGSFGDEVPNFKGIFEIAFLSVKASLTAAESLVTELQADVAINICGGWHHAFEDKGRGFCIFNDIAIVVEYFIKKKKIKKVMVIDYDAHHGDGTQRAFFERADVFTISLHQDPSTLYPFLTGFEDEIGVGKGKNFNRNFPLPIFCDDKEFIKNFEKAAELITNYNPEILIVQMGVDGSKECVVANLQLTEKSYDYASKTIMNLKKKLGFKVLALGGGGFVHPMLGQNWGIQIKNFIG